MSVKFYIHTPMPDDMSERRAIFRVARLLGRHFPDDNLLLIANIDPQKTRNLQFSQPLPQLDGLLLGSRFMALLEFKNAFDRIEAPSLTSTWYGINAKGRSPIKAGSKINPYEQARNARSIWSGYLREGTWPFLSDERRKELVDAWFHLQAFVLFHPYLHPDSQFPPLGKDSMWLRLRGINAMAELPITTIDKKLQLSEAEIERLAVEAFRAVPWTEMEHVLYEPFGYVCILEPPDIPVRYRIHQFEEFTLGRSSAVIGHCVDERFERVSRFHLRIETSRHMITMFDLHSGNGTFVDGQKLAPEVGVPLLPGTRVHLGDPGPRACQIWFEPIQPRNQVTKATRK